MLPHIAELLEAARLAPSRDNLQPWRFAVDGETVSFSVDAERDTPRLDPGGRMARIAVGAAIESVLVRAARMGATAKVVEPAREGALVTMTFAGHKRVPDLDKGIARRVTNRHEYDGRAIDDETFVALRDSTPALGAARAQWFGRERVRTLAPIFEDAEALLLSSAETRAATLASIRFDARDRDEVEYGVSIGSLELSAGERVTLDEIRRASAADAPSAANAFRRLAARTRRLVESASGVCVVTTSGDAPEADVNAGRTMMRGWLALARRGMVAQPLSAVATLDALLSRDDRATLPATDIERAGAVVQAMRAAVPSVEEGARVAIVLRVGWTTATPTRVGRRALADSVKEPQ
jgi:hypothetical protein